MATCCTYNTSIFTFLENTDELSEVEATDIRLDNDWAKRKQVSAAVQKVYDNMYNADDIRIYKTIYSNIRVGSSKKLELYFFYFHDCSILRVVTTFTLFISTFFMCGTFSSEEGGCCCEDCIQTKLDVYANKSKTPFYSVAEVKQHFKDLFLH
jgi:hypothetical protein